VVTEFTITNLADSFGAGGAFKLYYTTNIDERGKSSSDYQASDFTAQGTVWTELTVDTATGAALLPENFKPVAIAAVGTIPGGQTLKMHVTLDLPEGRPNEIVINRLTRDNLTSYGRSYIVDRRLEGLSWLDVNGNGLQDSGEVRQSGVTVTLMKLKPNGSAADLNDYEPYTFIPIGQIDPVTARVATGSQLSLTTGQTTAYQTGRYLFSGLPEGTFGVLFTDEETQKIHFHMYNASPQNVGDDETVDSDSAAITDNDGQLEQAFILGIAMPAPEEISTIVYLSRYHDLGLVRRMVDVPVEKIWDDAHNMEGSDHKVS